MSHPQLAGMISVVFASAAPFVIGCGSHAAIHEAHSQESRLVVAVVVDQLGAAQLEKYLPYLSEEGAIKMGVRRGAFFTHGEYPYASTYTAPSHTTIYSGVGPWKHGVVANRVWDDARQAACPVMDDGKHAVIGAPDHHASPLAIRAPVVADQLKAATGGHGKVVSLSIKDRAAIPGGGQKPDLVLWFDGEAGGFTTSSFYSERLPQWLESWRTGHPWDEAVGPWVPENPALLERLLGPDAQPGEGMSFGLDPAFPHDPRSTSRPSAIFKMTPKSTEYLLALAREAVSQLQLGRDEVPDLLALSVSAVDFAGHFFGPDSWEYMETLIRSDEAVGRFIADLEKRTTVSVVLTSDHGVAPFPERTGKGGRLFVPGLTEELNRSLLPTLGEGPWIAAHAAPFLYLTAKARSNRKQVVSASISLLDALPSVHRAFDVERIRGRVDDPDPVVRSVAKSLYPEVGGDVFVVPAEYFILDEIEPRDHNTTHGSPWDYDALVPIIAWGPGVEIAKHTRRIQMNHVASTLARLLGVAPPGEAPDSALPGIP